MHHRHYCGTPPHIRPQVAWNREPELDRDVTARTRAKWKTVLTIVLSVAALAFLSKKVHDSVNVDVLGSHAAEQFPMTAQARWFIPPVDNAQAGTAKFTINGLHDTGRHSVLRLENWETRQPVVIIPIRANETAVLQVPLGRYRVTYANNAAWQRDFKLTGEVREAVEPLEFYRSGNQTFGHRIDLNKRVNGNMKTRASGLF